MSSLCSIGAILNIVHEKGNYDLRKAKYFVSATLNHYNFVHSKIFYIRTVYYKLDYKL